MKNLLFAVVAFMLPGILIAQSEYCGYEDYKDYLISQDSNYRFLYYAKKQWVEKYRKEKYSDTGNQEPNSQPFGGMEMMGMPSGGSCPETQYIVPVLVHVVHLPSDTAPGMGTNISDAQVEHQIDLLNAHFSNAAGAGGLATDTKIQFCLAQYVNDSFPTSGILRYSSSLSTHNYPSQIASLFGMYGPPSIGNQLIRDRDRYMHVYVVNTILDNGVDAGKRGYATMPGGPQSGIVIRYDWFGDFATCSGCPIDSNSYGYALTHEAGHFLGLEHTFFNGCTTPDSCSTTGDLCCDTPPCIQAGSDCSASNTCHENYNGDLNDPIENYMGYNVLGCMNTFTPQQTEIMYAVLENARSELIKPKSVNALELACCHLSAFFGADNTFLCKQQIDTVEFEAYHYQGASYYWEIRDSSGSLVASHTDTVPTFRHVFDTIPEKYSVELEVTRGLDMVSFNQSRFIEIADCGNPLASTKGSWLFGKYAGILFTDMGVIRDLTPIDRSPNAINTSEGTISISDSAGDMLFHGGGLSSDIGDFHLFGKDYLPMPHGPVLGDGSSSQGGLVVPVPGSANRYYLFTVAARFNSSTPITTEGFRYSIVDMTLNSGNGDVDTNFKNVIVKAVPGVYPNPYDSAFMPGEVISSIPQCNSINHWVLVAGADSANVATGSGYSYLYVFSLDSTGLTYHSKSDLPALNFYGGIKVSPNGKYVFCAGTLYEFDRINGQLKAIKQFDNSEQYYGSSFSPDSRLLYLLIGNPADYPNNTIYQYDLAYTNPEVSARAVGTILSLAPTAMQIGPDGKIYISRHSQNRLAVIDDPNQRLSGDGTNECAFTLEGPLLSSAGIGGICGQGLPNFSDVSEAINEVDFTYTDSACGHVKFRPITCSEDNVWYFGDGDSATTWEVSHTYAAAGDYPVTLITGGDTLTKTLHIGVDKPIITGDSIICDSSEQYLYSVGNICYNCEYSWVAGGGEVFSGSNPYEVLVDWNEAYGLKLISVNQLNGCSDSATLPVASRYFIENLIEDSNLVVCNNSVPLPIYGSKPTPGDFPFTYQWRISDDSLNWTEITGATFQHLQPDTIRDTVKYFQRIVYLADCDTFYSNITKRIPDFYEVSDNFITTTDSPDLKGCSFEITGSTPTIGSGAAPIYTWYYSLNDTDWTELPSASWSQKNLDYLLEADSFSVYRKVGASACISYSDTVRVKPDIVITRDPVDYYTCNSRVYFSVGYDNPKGLTVQHTWMFSDTVGGSIDGILPYGSNPLNYFENTGFYGKYYVCQLAIPGTGCTRWTDWGLYERNPDTLVFFDSVWVSDTLANEWDTALAIARDSIVELDSGAFQRQYIWQKSHNGVDFADIGWDSAWLAENNNDTFRITDQRACEWYTYYRVRVQAAEGCPFVFSNSTEAIRTYTGAKLMMRDYYDDNGTEPNDSTDWRNLYNPPSLLIRLDDDNGVEHEIPDWGTDTAYVYYTIHNIGTQDSSKPAKLKMYWTSGGPHGADWEIAWKDATGNRFQNLDPTNDSAYLNWYPYGDFINEIPIEVPSIAPGDSIRDYFMWTDFPNPYRYYVWQNGNRHYPNPRIMCMLARIETCPEDSFGLSYKEVAATRQNIINNRKIVGRNTSVNNIFWHQGKKEVPLTVRRFDGDDEPIRLELQEVGTCGFASYGSVKAVLSDALWEAWRDGGYAGSGYSIESYGVLEVTDLSDFEVRNIELDPDSVSLITFEFELTSNPFIVLNCRYAFAQYQGNTNLTPYGTFVLDVKAIGEPFQGGQIKEEEDPLATGQDSLVGMDNGGEMELMEQDKEVDAESTTLVERSLFAYPNPFTNEVSFYFELASAENVGFEIYNGLGAIVGQIDAREYSKGKHKVMFDGSRLAPGMYLCKVRIGEEIRSIKLIVER